MNRNPAPESSADLAWFLERLVHDLREPLRSIHSRSELLAEVMEDPSGASAALVREELISGALRMRTLIDGLSAYTLALRPSTGAASLQLAFDMALMSLEAPIRETAAAVAGEGLPRVAVGLERLSQLMENLIGNSLRFRGEAAPRVKVSAAEENPGWWLVAVEDNGIGIDPRECEAVFAPFTRLHGRKYPGAGLGLAACRKIVENHGGKIRIESAPGKGCVCRFTLPADLGSDGFGA